MSESLPVQCWPVGYTADQTSKVDEVEVILWMDPRTANVVYLEANVVWSHSWAYLYEAECN